MPEVDAITLQVVAATLSGIVREMQNSLYRTGYSTIIRESHDASCAILDAQGRLVGQHVVLPLHMGAFPACAEALLARYPAAEMAPGDAYLMNHPYYGGSPHASDMAVLSPVFYDGRLVAFCCSMAHKPDIGGTVPGSGAGDARELFHEGLQVPPVRYVDGRGDRPPQPPNSGGSLPLQLSNSGGSLPPPPPNSGGNPMMVPASDPLAPPQQGRGGVYPFSPSPPSVGGLGGPSSPGVQGQGRSQYAASHPARGGGGCPPNIPPLNSPGGVGGVPPQSPFVRVSGGRRPPPPPTPQSWGPGGPPPPAPSKLSCAPTAVPPS
jgi:hypothetical protein